MVKKTKELLSKAEKCAALYLTWDTVGLLIANELERLVSKSIRICAGYSDIEYWCCEFCGYRMDVTTQERLLDAIGATDSERRETMYYSDDVCTDSAQPIKSLGMEVSRKLLLLALDLDKAMDISISENGLWVIYKEDCLTTADKEADNA